MEAKNLRDSDQKLQIQVASDIQPVRILVELLLECGVGLRASFPHGMVCASKVLAAAACAGMLSGKDMPIVG